ncbi:tetratricopeptide repeat protein [uncultured Brachyspira sp.]|uniref:tetratricopeptide repeat protein n=1 Tax=uncultured Brachyspira sp. TaxID=221953 RepID=UPI0025EEC923|nr:tetratricopeptide repeat protein [uncultured Brachyspira sp.]
MKEIFKYFILIICFLSALSCDKQVFTNRFNLNKAYNLYEKGKNEDDDKALLEITSTYNSIINQKIYAQDRLAAVYRVLAERSLAKQQYAYSAKYFTEALKILPNSPYLRYGLGISYMNLSESADTYEQKTNFIKRAENNIVFAISKDSNNANYYAALASLKGVHQDNYEEAFENIKKAVEINPNNADYLFLLARIQYSRRNYNEAVAAYRKILNMPVENNLKQTVLNNINQIIGQQN